jgi:4-hydroxy-tetrahydrodipicolinate synthase
VSNLVPAKVAALVQAGLNKDFAKARQIHYELLPLFKAAFVETNPIPIKAALSMIGLPAGPTRLPLGPFSESNREILRKAIKDIGL